MCPTYTETLKLATAVLSTFIGKLATHQSLLNQNLEVCFCGI